MTDSKKDYRYKMPDGSEIEAYQLTAANAWMIDDWPPWLKKQSGAAEVNTVYRPVNDAGSLYISLPEGEFCIEEGAWLMHDGQSLSVCNADNFQSATKVVPADVKAESPPADGFESDADFAPHAPPDPHLKVVGAKDEPVPGIDDLDEVVAVAVPLPVDDDALLAIKVAIEMIQNDDPDLALEHLRSGLSARTVWCACNPGSCDGLEIWSCRQNSPLVK